MQIIQYSAAGAVPNSCLRPFLREILELSVDRSMMKGDVPTFITRWLISSLFLIMLPMKIFSIISLIRLPTDFTSAL